MLNDGATSSARIGPLLTSGVGVEELVMKTARVIGVPQDTRPPVGSCWENLTCVSWNLGDSGMVTPTKRGCSWSYSCLAVVQRRERALAGTVSTTTKGMCPRCMFPLDQKWSYFSGNLAQLCPGGSGLQAIRC